MGQTAPKFSLVEFLAFFSPACVLVLVAALLGLFPASVFETEVSAFIGSILAVLAIPVLFSGGLMISALTRYTVEPLARSAVGIRLGMRLASTEAVLSQYEEFKPLFEQRIEDVFGATTIEAAGININEYNKEEKLFLLISTWVWENLKAQEVRKFYAYWLMMRNLAGAFSLVLLVGLFDLISHWLAPNWGIELLEADMGLAAILLSLVVIGVSWKAAVPYRSAYIRETILGFLAATSQVSWKTSSKSAAVTTTTDSAAG